MTTLNEYATKIANKITAVKEGEKKVTIDPKAMQQVKEIVEKIEKVTDYKEEDIDLLVLDITSDVFNKQFITGDIVNSVLQPVSDELHNDIVAQLEATAKYHTPASTFVLKVMADTLIKQGHFYI